MDRDFLEELVRNIDDLPTGTAAAVFLLKVIRGEDYTHAEIARILGRSPEEIDQVERDCRQQFEVGKWRELIRGIKESIDDAGGRLL